MSTCSVRALCMYAYIQMMNTYNMCVISSW